MSEASSGRAAGGEPGGHEAPTTSAVQLTWQCTSSACHMELKGIPLNSLPLCPFCGTRQEGFSHHSPGDVCEPRPKSPQNKTAAHERAQHSKDPESSDTVPVDASSSTKATNVMEVDTSGGEASNWSKEDLPLPETPPPNKCPKINGARDHSDSPEPGSSKAIPPPPSSHTKTPVSTSAQLPQLKLTLSTPSTPLSHSEPSPSSLPLSPPSGPPPPSIGHSSSQPGPPSPPPELRPETNKPVESSKTQTGASKAGVPSKGHSLKGDPLANKEAPLGPLSDDNLATGSTEKPKSTGLSQLPTQPSDNSPDLFVDGPPGKRRKAANGRTVVIDGHSSKKVSVVPPPKEKEKLKGSKYEGADEPHDVMPKQPDDGSSGLLGRRPLHEATAAGTQSPATTTDKKTRTGTVEDEAGRQGPPSANTRSKSSVSSEVPEGEFYRKTERLPDLYEGTAKSGKGKKQTEKLPPVPGDVTTCGIPGLNPPAHKCLAVTFHVLVPIKLWEWTDESRIHLVFGNAKLGKWKEPVGEFGAPKRMIEDGLYEMQCTLNIDIEVLKTSSVPYKYIIFSPLRQGKNKFEFIHNSPGYGITNRCLLIPKNHLHCSGTYDVYDNVVYPQEEIEGNHPMMTKLWDKAKSVFTSSERGDQLVVPDHTTMQVMCLHAYLSNLKKVLIGLALSSEKDIGSAVHHIMVIFRQMFTQHIINDEYGNYIRDWTSNDVLQEIVEWLKSIVEEVKGESFSPGKNGKRIATIIVIIICFHKLDGMRLKMSSDYAALLLSLLKLKPDKETPSCCDFELVKSLLNTAANNALAAFEFLFSKLSYMEYVDNAQWLYAFPIIHFLKGKCAPFDGPLLNPEKIDWNDESLPRMAFEKSVQQGPSKFVESHFDSMSELFAFDPCLLPIFVRVCPKLELPFLILKLPPHVSLSWLSKLTQECKNWREEVRQLRLHAENITEVVKAAPVAQHYKPDYLEATLSGSLMYLSSLRGRILSVAKDTTIGKENISLLMCNIELISNAAMQLNTWHKSHSEEDTTHISECVGRLTAFLKELVVNRIVIGGSMFGNTMLRRADMEFHLWESLLNIDCHEAFLDKWHNVVHRIVKSRVDALVPFNRKIDLLSRLKAETHSVLADIFVEAAMHSLERMMDESKRDAAATVNDLMLTVDKKRVGELMGTLIRKQYPNGADGVTFDELLQWDLWPSIIKVYTNEALMTRESHHGRVSCLPESCISACAVAHSIFIDLCDKVTKGTVTVTELENISKREEHVGSLCAAASGDTKDRKKFTALKKSIGCRMAEFKALRSHREQLDILCHLITIPVTGVEELRCTLKSDISSEQICRLCTSDDKGNFAFPYLSAAISLAPMVRQFFLLTQKYPNTIFEQIWSNTLKIVSSSGSTLDLTDIVSVVWNPTFKLCQVLLESLIKQTVQLGEVDKYFHQYSEDRPRLTETITSYYHGMLACTEGKDRNKVKWIQTVVVSMQKYWSLSRYSDAAATLLQLKDKLHLTGDFVVVEQLAAKVNKSMRDQPLRAIDESLVETGRFLDDFVGNDQKLRCLETFCSCTSIVEWLRKETEDVSDLQNFVSVALSTAAGGEGDLANDQLSNLRTVGSGFGSLIYDLKCDAGFLVFKECCKSLWESLEHTHTLPKLLRECDKELGWYKAVKETQGSVERSTFGQMGAIMECGMYLVDSSTSKVVESIHEIILVTLLERDKRLHKTLYTLDELRDLESKLVLITGSRAENRETVDLFLDTLHCVCRIAEALIALQQAGAVEYIGWSIAIPCAENMLIDLRQVAEEMEQRLYAWNEEVVHARKKFYELNYFTTKQLLMLRKDMTQVKSLDVSCSVCPSVLTLLQSISTEVNMDTVRDVMQRVCGQHSDVTQGLDDVPIQQHVEPSTCPAEHSMSASTLASSDEHTSSSLADRPINRCDENILSAEQLEIIAYLTERFQFSNQLVQKALQECGDDVHECLNWCRDNDGAFTFTDVEEEIVSEDEMPSDTEPEDAMEIPTTEPSEHIISDSVRPNIKVTAKELIDQNHPEVQRLHEAGYSMEESITALQRCGTASAAIDYLIMSTEAEESEELFQFSRAFSGSTSGDRTGAVYSQKEITLQMDLEVKTKYLSLRELGLILRVISELFPSSGLQFARPFSSYLKSGQPNLIVSLPENVLKTVLALYMEEESSPLPSYDEVLICNQFTTEEEVTLLWRRAIDDPGFKRVFCLVYAENLSYQVCDRALHSLQDISQGKDGYRVVIVCSNQDEDKSHIVSKLQIYRKQFVIPKDASYRDYLKYHFTLSVDGTEYPTHQQGILMNASAVDLDNSCVRVVSSQRSGMGKSLYIRRRAEFLVDLNPTSKGCVTIPVHGPRVTPDSVMAFLKDHIANSTGTIFHIDVSPSVLHLMDTILFSLLVLRGLRDSLGYMWRCHTSQLYAVEVTKSGIKEQQRCCLALLDLLPTVECIAPTEVLETMASGSGVSTKIVMDDEEFKSERYQRVYQYLRRHVANHNLDTFSYPGNVEQSPKECLNLLRRHSGVRDPSWSEICHFVTFLNVQLQSCEQSVFCNEAFVSDVMSGLKSFMVNFMMAMSKDFATSSLHGEVVRENREETDNVDDQTVEYAIDQRKRWEQSAHPYIFFNQDSFSITFVGFRVSPDGRVLDPDGGIIKVATMSPQLLAGLKHNKVDFAEDYRQWSKSKMIEKMGTVLGLEFVYDPDPTYVLTADNLVKILAIHMRFRCNIPVVIMGETGCGKTRLIRFMCNLMAQGRGQQNMLILKVHGGITERDISKFVEKGIAIAKENRKHNLDTVLFFDEANTTDAIGLIKEILCDRRLHGYPLTTDIKFIAACNPYRKHSSEMISKLESAGLGFYVRMNETLDKLGSIPLRQLVYRVLDLPHSMRPLVYDFGQLNPQTEQDYSYQIVLDYVSKANSRLLDPNKAQCIARVLAFSQQYMRERKDECSFVSLRDVKRAIIVFDYFLGKIVDFRPFMDAKAAKENRKLQPPDPVTRSLVLAIGVCYHARLQGRQEFEHQIAAQFVPPLKLPGGARQFRNEIRYCQEVLLDNMKIGMNIAKNAALRENIFMMAVCIELRIPLFLVGKPGSSKSLAKSIIADSMRGKVSQSDLLRDFKEVHMLSFQCSQLSTPEGVIEIFAAAKRFQKDQDTSKYVSVVVLDEVGLAEDSPNLPLKALHPLLEDGTEQSDVDEIVDREQRVAFIGISNWALDPAKMNRGVMVTRSDPDEQELEFSARGICSFKEDDPVNERLKPYFKLLASAYKEVYRTQTKDFFGLRDFYSLIKMLYWMCKQSDIPLTAPQLEHAIRRNFGGWEDEHLNPLKVFRARVHATEPPDLSSFPPERHHIICPDCTKLGLIKTSLETKETTWHGENRYLLFLTENYAALDILRHYLKDTLSSTLSDSPSDEDTEPFILFGSSFPRDKEYTQVCRNINRIKICMETGRTVILLNLENLYESLYDLLNQYYLHQGGQRYVDLGLQTLRVKCRVHDNFKLILIAEKTTVYEKFPTPLINRMEKHFVLTSSVLQDWQQHVLRSLIEWISNFSEVIRSRDKKFSEEDAFIGYQKDTPAAAIFQATNQLEKLRQKHPITVQKLMAVLNSGLLGFTLDDVTEEMPSDQFEVMVLALSKYLMLLTAPEDALIRLKGTRLADSFNQQIQLYFKFHFSTVSDFLKHHLSNTCTGSGQMFQVTTHSHLIPLNKVVELECSLDLKVSSCVLQQFDTELDFTNNISPSFKKIESTDVLLIIQCDSGHMSGDLIACARYRVLEERRESVQQPIQSRTHVLFIIHLPKREFGSSFVGFQGDPWVCTHIDNLLPPEDAIGTPQLQDVMGRSISKLFYQAENAPRQDSDDDIDIEPDTQYIDDDMEHDSTEVPVLDQEPLHLVSEGQIHFCIRLHGCIHAAVSRVEDNESHSLSKSRAKQRVDILLRLIPKEPSGVIDQTTFFGIIVNHIHRLLEEREHIYDHGADWVLVEALDSKKLQSGGTLRNVLARKLDEEMSRPFTEIIAFIDHHYNLDILYEAFSDRSKAHLAHVWLAIFGLPAILPFKFSDLITGQKVPGVGGRLSISEFRCHFPFSWIVKQSFDDVWINAKTVAGHGKVNQWNQLCAEVQITHIGKVLMDVDECDSHSLYEYYLHDFVRMVHSCHHKKPEFSDLEYKLVCRSLHSLVLCKEFSTMDGHKNLLQLIASLHVIYHIFESKVMWFGQLASCMPQILQKLDQIQYTDSDEMILHLCAVECALSSDTLKPPIEKEENIWNNWLTLLRQSRIAVDSIISISAQHPRAIEARNKWQLTRVLQLFVEHVLLKHEYVVVPQVRRLHLFLEKDSDFLRASAIEKVKRHLNSMISTLKRNRMERLQMKNSCRAYFMEVVSSLCFGGVGVPEPQLVKLLLDTVFINSDEEQVTTQDLTPYQGEQDSVPVIRSFILQLLLEHSSEQVKEHLNEYFLRSSRALSNTTVDSNVCLLIVKCFEDNLYREHAAKSLTERMGLACRFFKSCTNALVGHAVSSHDITLDYLEGVAGVRFALLQTADILNSRASGARQHSFTAQADDVIRLAQKICTDTRINHIDVTGTTDTIGPNVYLLKLLVRQFGAARTMELSKSYGWVVPPQLKTEHSEVKTHDPFVIYEQVYSNLRQVLNDAAYGKQYQQLKETAEVLTLQEAPLLLLALYEKATLSRASVLPSKQLLPEVLEIFEEIITGSKLLSDELKLMARALIANQQGGPLGQMQVTPTPQSAHCRVLGGVVIHAATVFLYHKRMGILLPFINMLNCPSALANVYLPTMPQDHLAEVRKAGGTFYECPRGHPYYVGECGQPMEERTCRVCGSGIGGINHRLRSDNRGARVNDTTQRGYALGNPEDRSEVPTPERKLSPASCCIVRALMHCALVWASCNNEPAVEGLCQLVKKRPQELAEFFWRHLERDLQLLGRAINKNTEECALVLHLVLKNILTCNTVPSGDIVKTVNGLGSQNARETWEYLFNRAYIQPVLETTDKSIGDAMGVILNDDHQEHDHLFYLVYERVSVSKDSLAPHLWTYRARITLEHLSQTLQQQSNKTKCPILFEFLMEEPSLRATQYLPDIIRLQQRLYDCFHRRLDRKDASRFTIGDFLRQRTNEHTRNEYKMLIDSFKCAWILTRDKLHHHGRLRVDEEYISQDINDATPLEYLIPTTTGPGACSMALADFLTLTHNEFILRCRAIINEGTASNFMWDECKVPITHLHRCHLLDYEHQLLSIILSHCHYSLTLGKGEDVSYDLPALEKHILDRFIHGKPTILADIPQVVYRQDVYNAATFAAIRSKVKPQLRLSTQAQHEIVAELRSMEKLRDNLDVVEIVIGFLSSGGGRADKSLADYIRTLKMSRKSFSKKAKEHCTLGHVLSLWELLSVHLAKRLVLKDQEPFDTLLAEYHEDITPKQKQSLDCCLGSFELGQLLGVLYEFLEVYVRHSPPTDKEWPLVETLVSYQERYEIPLIAHFEDKFPPDITLAQATAAWKYVVEYHARMQGRARPK